MRDDLVVVSVGVDGRDKYSNYALRLQNSCNERKIESRIWINEYPPQSPSHQQAPYAFKYFALKHVYNEGFRKVLWLDSICRIAGPIEEIIKILDIDGYFFPPDGWYVGQWCKDSALGPLGLTRDEAMQIPVIAAKHLGFNFNFDKCLQLLEQFKYFIDYDNGEVIRGPWTNSKQECSNDPRVLGHRHDQTILSVLSYRLGMYDKGVWNDMISWNGEEKPKQVIRVH